MQSYQAVQLTAAVDMKLHFLPKNAIYLFNLSHLIGGDGFLCTDVRGDISRHPSKMDCLESVSEIAQMLTAGYMPSPTRAHSSSETFWKL